MQSASFRTNAIVPIFSPHNKPDVSCSQMIPFRCFRPFPLPSLEDVVRATRPAVDPSPFSSPLPPPGPLQPPTAHGRGVTSRLRSKSGPGKSQETENDRANFRSGKSKHLTYVHIKNTCMMEYDNLFHSLTVQKCFYLLCIIDVYNGGPGTMDIYVYVPPI